jgi:ABC-2 type transport system ATP-binding protein
VIIGLDARVLEYHRRRTALPRLPGTTARGGGAAGGPVAAPGWSAFKHLLGLALTHGIVRRRVDEVIALAGLEEVAHKRVGGFSFGMGQRPGIAAFAR